MNSLPQPSARKPLVTIICPAHNEEQNIDLFYTRVAAMAVPLSDRYDFEILFMNNRSTDRTRELILERAEQDERVRLITLSRNFGYQASVLCGITYANGDASVVIDIDCEDPPEMIADFIRKWEEGYEVIYGIRNQRMEAQFIQAMRGWFYWLLQKTGDADIVMHMAEFSLITREVRHHIVNNKSTFPFLRTEIAYVGFKRIGLNYMRQARVHGKTHYNFWRMLTFAIGGILSSSTFLLRIAAYIGAVLLVLNVILLTLNLFDLWSKAFSTLITLDLMYLIFFVAVASVYIARIYKNGVGRPVFIVDWKQSLYSRPEDTD